MTKSELPKDLAITQEDREKLEREIEEAEKRLPNKPRKPIQAPVLVEEPAPVVVDDPKFYEQVQAEIAKLHQDDPEWTPEAMPQPVKAAGGVVGSPRRGSPMMEIEAITIPPGRREILESKVEALMESITEVGLLHPVVVTPERRLVAGGHRVEACRRLGWTEIPVNIIAYDALRGEMAMLDENLARNDMSALERAEALSRRKQLYEQLHPQVKHGGAPGKAGGGKRRIAADKAVPSFMADTSSKTGMSTRSISNDTRIVKGICKETRDRIKRSELSRNQTELLKLSRIRNQEEQREIAVMVVDGKAKNVDDAMRRRRLRVRHEEIAQKNAESAKLEAGEGPVAYPIIIADVPWRYTRSVGKSRDIDANQYETMPTAEIAGLPVADVFAQDCICWFWVPAAKLEDAVDIIREWGLKVSSSMVWDKGHIGPGIWARIQHELILVCTRGNPPPPLEADKPESIIRAPRGEHSVKPEDLHLMIERAYPKLEKLELFARKRRPGWKCLGLDIDGTDISVAISSVKQRAGMKMEPEVVSGDDLPSAAEPAPDSPTGPPAPPAE